MFILSCTKNGASFFFVMALVTFINVIFTNFDCTKIVSIGDHFQL